MNWPAPSMTVKFVEDLLEPILNGDEFGLAGRIATTLTDEILVIGECRFQEPLSQALADGLSGNSFSLTSTRDRQPAAPVGICFSASSAGAGTRPGPPWSLVRAGNQPVGDQGTDERQEHDQHSRGEERGCRRDHLRTCSTAEGRFARMGSSRRKRCRSSASSWAEA